MTITDTIGQPDLGQVVTAVPTAASVAVLPQLAGPARAARIVGLYPTALYLDDGHMTIAVVTRDAVRLPNALVLAASRTEQPFAGVRAEATASIGDGAVTVGALRFAPARTWEARPVLQPARPRALAHQIQALARLLAAHPPGIAVHPRFAAACARRDTATAATAATSMVGLGPGLTPSGDDILAGTLAALRLLGGDGPLTDALATAALTNARSRTTTLAAALLGCAAHGQVSLQVADVLRGLTGEQPLAPAVARLLSVGHTSGADLAHGLLVGARAAGRHLDAETSTYDHAVREHRDRRLSA